MLKTILLAAMIILIPAAHWTAYAADGTSLHEEILKPGEKDILRELEYKIKTHGAFLKATATIVNETGNSEALSFVRMAEASAKEAMVHYQAGDYELSLEDFSESTQRAIHAITIAKNPDDKSVREFVIQEELILAERRDMERKAAMIKKGMAEVAVFLKTADRLASEDENSGAAEKIAQARSLYESANKASSEDRLDDALENIQDAYKLVIAAIKDIKHSKQDIITFPKPVGTDVRDIFSYELKRNDAYLYFATQVINKDDAKAAAVLKAGQSARAEAEGLLKSAEMSKAVSRLKESTELFIKAVKTSVVK
ncbi:MAG TPA: hypothetical protein VNK06_00570 [Thermodesulfobacteriota bacterium]|nr:hypothetical protein [Thermodesulfobacteriota bacterium]